MGLFRKIYRGYLYLAGSSKAKCSYLRKQGAKIGKNTTIHGGLNTFGTEPYLIEVGNDCLFAYDVRLITHDGGTNVLNRLYNIEPRVDKMGKIKIGNNTYFGMGAFVMPNVTIGNNCIVGAGSIVSKDLPDNGVYAGVPAKFICSIEDYNNKCKDTIIKRVPASQKKGYITQIFENKL